jgi:N-acetylglucosamine kinase-like BadF-type ATPase
MMVYTDLIVDSGTTKTDWFVVRAGTVLGSACTKGLNPYFQSYEEIWEEIGNVSFHGLNVISADELSIDRVYFYGAGCVFDKAEIMREALSSRILAREIRVCSDLLAAAHSTCGHEAGIACILGTGSNSCFYDGQ